MVIGTWRRPSPIAGEAIRGFSNAKLAVVHGATHGVWEELFQHWGPVRGTVRDFMLRRKTDLPPEITLPPVDYTIPER